MKKFTLAQNRVLSEIYRRLNYFHKGNLSENLLYLALPSEAKIISEFDLIKPYSKEIPRVLNWYNLTEKGKKFFSNYITPSKLPDNINTKIFNKTHSFTFDYSLLNKNYELQD